jgi:type II secretory pathway component GspD/PulD (secretin)
VPSNGAGVQTSPGSAEDRITLNVKDTDINDILKFLSLQRRVNIVASKDVSGPISVNLYDVPFDMALRAILQSHGFTAQQRDNVIFVTKAVEQPNSATPSMPTSMRTFRLNYANIPEAAEMVQQLLSPQGKMVLGKESKTLLVDDTVETVAKVGRLLQSLDTKPRQVLIEAKILEVTLDNDTALGINWDVLFGHNGAGDRLGRVSTQGFAANPLLGPPGFFFSIVDTDITALLSALQERKKLNTLANPKILTVDGREAEILIGAKLGYRVTTTTQTATLESVQFLDVGTELVILPSIGDDGYILMNVHPKVSDGTVTAGLPSETTTEATTSVLMKDGETIIIGGLIRERDEESRTQVPLLGYIPVLGPLFRNRRTSREKTEIAVLITPHIVQGAPAIAAAAQPPGTPPQPGRPRQMGKIWDADFVMALSKAL